MMVII